MKKNEEPKKGGKTAGDENASKNCYQLKKHPSVTPGTRYQARVCPDPDKYKKKCPPPLEVCKDSDVEDLCAVKKKRGAAISIADDIVVVPRGKPPQCPKAENPCANDNKNIDPCQPKEASKSDNPCGEQDDDD